METIKIEGKTYSVYNESKEQFLGYCQAQLESIKCAIDKKSRGSTVEDMYFMEHWEKLRNYFLTTQVNINMKNE